GGVPAALLLVEAAEQQVHLSVELPVGMGLGSLAVGALALVRLSNRHAQTPLSQAGEGGSIVKPLEVVLQWPLVYRVVSSQRVAAITSHPRFGGGMMHA